jgi:hypothetical protein
VGTDLVLRTTLVSTHHLTFTSINLTVILAGNLTAWGFQDTLRDPHNGGFGGNRKRPSLIYFFAFLTSPSVPKLLSRHLPRHYPFVRTYVRCTLALQSQFFATELDLHLFPLLYSPKDEGQLDKARPRSPLYI